MLEAIPFASYGTCVLAYLALAVAGAIKGTGAVWRWPVVAASLATGAWAALSLGSQIGILPAFPARLSEILRDVSWLHLLLALLGRIDTGTSLHARPPSPAWALLPGFLGIMAIMAGADLPWLEPLQGMMGPVSRGLPVIMPVLGMLALENVFRTSGPSGRWGLKYLCLGLGTIFAFDLVFYSNGLLLNGLERDLMGARGFVATLAAAPLAVSLPRMRSWTRPRDVALNASHRGVFFSTALAASGVYLLVMAAAAFYIRETGGLWGPTLQITFLIGGFVLLLAVFASDTLRSKAKILLLKHFFSYKYDYREEWLRFIQVMSDHQSLTLGERLVRAMADMMNSPAGALWVWRQADAAFMPDAAWNYRGLRPSVDRTLPLVGFLARTGWSLEFADVGAAPDRYPGLSLPDWIADHAQGWIVIPLLHRAQLLGFIVLDQARAPQRLDWEDRDLLQTTAAHGASYLAEELATAALLDAQRFEEFNRRFAFVVHDIKNVVGQMSLMVDNAKRFGDNPDFQRDMMETVQNSVQRMKGLLEQLAEKRRQSHAVAAPLDLAPVLDDVGRRWRRTKPSLVVDVPAGPVEAHAIRDTLVSVLDLLIDNAFAAASHAVQLRLYTTGADAVVEVQDDGPGMDPSFIRTELFQPMRSTKSAGFGIGAYQTRHLIREMGGRLEVDSAPGQGTRMRVHLPLATAAALCDAT